MRPQRLVAVLTTVFILVAIPHLAFGEEVPGANTCTDNPPGFPEANKSGPPLISGDWGTATWENDSDFTLDVDLNEGWSVEICVKAGNDGVHVFTVTEDTILGPFGDNGNGISHAAWQNATTSTTTTDPGTSTTEATTSTTTTTPETTTTVESTTITSSPTSTTISTSTTIQESSSTTEPVTATLPFTGPSGTVPLAVSAAGLLLLGLVTLRSARE